MWDTLLLRWVNGQWGRTHLLGLPSWEAELLEGGPSRSRPSGGCHSAQRPTGAALPGGLTHTWAAPSSQLPLSSTQGCYWTLRCQAPHLCTGHTECTLVAHSGSAAPPTH